MTASLRILYVGARLVGRRCLEALLAAGANVVGLLFLDDAKAGITVAHCDFSDLITTHRLHARTFTSLADPSLREWAVTLVPDVGMVVGVSQLVGAELLAIPRQGFIGMHPTMLPEGRGRAPIPWALIKGLERTGVSLFWCDPQADTGDLLAQQALPIHYEDTAATLGARADRIAAELLVQNLPLLATGTAPRIPQAGTLATVWPQRKPEDGLIDWALGKRQLYNWVRALTHPYPGAFTFCRGRKLYVWNARESYDLRSGPPGTVLQVLLHGALVATGEGSLLLTRLQWEGCPEDCAPCGLHSGDRLGENS